MQILFYLMKKKETLFLRESRKTSSKLDFFAILVYNLGMEKINKIIATNLATLRKSQNLTQAELAEKLNYTDKAISKWENSEALPDISVLYTLSNMYNVTLDYLVTEHTDNEIKKIITTNKNNKIVITSLSTSIVWILATIFFVYMKILSNTVNWVLFVWSVPLSCIILLVFNGIWGKRKFIFILLSIFTWTLLGSVFLQFIEKSIWPIFLLGVPFQISIILWSQLKKN